MASVTHAANDSSSTPDTIPASHETDDDALKSEDTFDETVRAREAHQEAVKLGSIPWKKLEDEEEA